MGKRGSVSTAGRSLAGRDLREPAWGPSAAQLQATASEVARGLPWRVAASPAALEEAGLTDARPGMAAVLDAYLATLPRVLVLVASSTDVAQTRRHTRPPPAWSPP
ncbi:hypothetical protein [Modestobacter marinus]|uniref:hypothetical protein n=1 Tax=Modestobacter marinus TaxID=477641 RepID=UPI00201AC128|nr:hypothetical protein [Modestobacter marinus]